MDVSEKLDNHELRITKLETNDAISEVRFSNLCKQIEMLTKALWFLGTTIIVTLIGFFIWYVQKGG
jgi:hypothetical protein